MNEIALYDLSNRPASFDFVTFLAIATTCGAKHVRFVLNNGWKPKDYTVNQAHERFQSIVEPAVALWGIDYSVGEREGVEFPHILKSAVQLYLTAKRINKIKYPIVEQDYVTITLRKSRTPARNSNDAEWRKFASRLSCSSIIIPDYEDVPLDLDKRMKLYAGAKMNFMVIHGPLTLCLHSDAPYLCMRTIGGPESGSTSPQMITRLTGITPGFQFPWANENQRLSYLDDTCENIEREYASMLSNERIAA